MMKHLLLTLILPAVALTASEPTEQEIVASNKHFRDGYQFMMIAEGTFDFSGNGPTKEQIEAGQKAKEEFEKAIELHPKNVEALVMLANLHWGKEEMDKTIELYSRAIEANPTADEVISARGGAYVYMKDFVSAKKDAQRLKELGSEFADTLSKEIEREEKQNKAVDTTAANARLFHNDTSKSTNSDVEAMTEAAVVSP